ncbi:MAG TPA: glycoside hydrolase family 31 protein [Anaerolineales bacterium]|nr:glycoside hydrolase family 31 protein [Anaerolineales bacterium]
MNAGVRITALGPNALRVTHAPPGETMPADRPWLAEVLLPQPAVEQSELSAEVGPDGCVSIRHTRSEFAWREAAPPRFGRAARKPRGGVSVDIGATEIRRERPAGRSPVSLTLQLDPGEGLYGFGAWFNAFRRERGRVKLKIRDAIAMLQERETYSAIPVFYSSRGYGIWFLNSFPAEFELDPEHGVLHVAFGGPNADFVFMYGPDFKRLITTYTALTGRPTLPPIWAFGLMVTGYPQEAPDVVLERVAEHRARGIPLDAVILDYHWEARYHDFQWRKSLFPDPAGFIAALQAQRVRLGLITTPFQNARTRPFQRWMLQRLAANRPPELYRDDERATELYAEGLANRYFAHPQAKWWFGSGGMLDFTNPAAVAWWNRLAEPRYREGVAFFKNDDGEYLPVDAASHLGLDGREHHNLYGFFYSRAMFEGMRALDDRRPFVYARSAWAGSQRFPALFLGDQKPTYAHMRATLRAGLNMGLLGFAHWTVDVFGLDGPTTPETHRRYAQWALFSPIARYFWRPPDVDNTRLPWAHDAETAESFRSHVELRYRLLPYLYGLAVEASESGVPPLRPMLVEYPDAAGLAHCDDQAMLGPDLLLAPVLEAEQTRRLVRLPAGDWYDLWTDRLIGGGRETTTVWVDGPASRVPLLVRGGALLPLARPRQFIDGEASFEALELHAYPPYPMSYSLHEDDGQTRAYQSGARARTDFTVVMEGDVLLFTATPGVEHWHPRFDNRAITLVVHDAPAPRATAVPDGIELAYDPTRRQLRIALSVPVTHPWAVKIPLDEP